VRTWVKKGSYRGEATNPSRQVSSASPAGECESPNLHSGQSTTDIPHHRILDKVIWSMRINSRLNERELAALHETRIHEHEQPSRFSGTRAT
jgi:hypothetical protein